ncbi:MAG: hypothetical protein COS85_01295 [Armatimonadetes bacterium CG07_land_8_20_14_0_80_59_28]|nr:MAG: hypothetical protein COS85_01295 [Armatimonadetes bacterium CG07_land_8_20_14_0_80_59_28]PIX41413.1 MAG: hypothetical protein COZ56_12190 [Armatimonadetes bacterium CG_4_8_14_3_um_filter_58_9]PIY48045.1 MAG: hypothetical protein COZ05_04280 [Armatimonadetes bacterium CG_4_10_14_3_um_filter_59_10]
MVQASIQALCQSGRCLDPAGRTQDGLSSDAQAPEGSHGLFGLRFLRTHRVRTYSPWVAASVRQQVQTFLLRWSLQLNPSAEIYLSVDDTNAPKYRGSKGFEGAAFHYNHTEGRATYGYAIVSLRLTAGTCSFAVSFRLYLREETVRKLNRGRPRDARLTHASKLDLAREMLTEVQSLLPKDRKIYVLFDRWYASKELIGYCREQSWHVICSLRSNRCLDGKSPNKVRLRNNEYAPTRVKGYSTDTTTTYLTYLLRGEVKGVGEVLVIVSKRNLRDKSREYFLCTNLSLRARGVLDRYAHRYQIESDYLYLKDRLGAADFRQRSLEGINKYLTVCFVTLTYLQWRQHQLEDARNLADVQRQHQHEHSVKFLTHVCQIALEHQAVLPALKAVGLLGTTP